MSSFRNFALDKIWWEPGDRDRKDIRGPSDEWEAFKASIAKGMINPPVVRYDGRLVAGERRITAARELGWTHLTVQFFEELSERELKLLELDENLRRKNLTWQEEALAFLNYHKLCAEEPGWTVPKTAAALGVSHNMLNLKIRVAEGLLSGDQRIVEAPKYSVALGIVQRSDARKRDSTVEEVDRAMGLAPIGHLEEELSDAELEAEDLQEEPSHPFLRADFREWAKNYSGPRFNLIHCDFPYGINANTHDQGAAASFGGYEDSLDTYWTLMTSLWENIDRVVAPAAHLIFWFSMKYYEGTRTKLAAMGWTVNPVPLIWHRSDNSGILPDPKRGPRQVYETAFFCSRGDRLIVRAKSNLFPSPNSKTFHMSEKPQPVLAHFFEMLIDETTVMLDPTCGSGNAVIVAHRMGAKEALGIELNEEFYNGAIANWKESQGDEG